MDNFLLSYEVTIVTMHFFYSLTFFHSDKWIKCSKILGQYLVCHKGGNSTDFNFSSPAFAVLPRFLLVQQKLPQKYQNHPKLILTTSTVSASTSTAGMFSFGS